MTNTDDYTKENCKLFAVRSDLVKPNSDYTKENCKRIYDPPLGRGYGFGLHEGELQVYLC